MPEATERTRQRRSERTDLRGSLDTRTTRRATPVAFAFLAAAAASACSGNSPSAPGGGDDTMRTVKEFPSFRSDVMDIFVRNTCTSDCHALGQGGLTLLANDAAFTYAQLVGEPAHSEDFLRVEPSNPDDSYVVIKVEGRNVVGSRMPPGDELDDVDLANLRNWISNGAPYN